MRKIVFAVLLGLTTLLAVSHRVSAQVCPIPQSMDVNTSEYFLIRNLTVACPDANSVKWVKDHLKLWFVKGVPEITAVPYNGDAPEEGAYKLTVGTDGVSVVAGTLQGVRYALYSLRQLAIPERGTLKVESWIAPKTLIDDKPALSFRGLHLCWFRENNSEFIERQIRMAAYYKLNYVVIEPWGTFKSKVAPWYCWDDAPLTKKECKRLRDIASDLGVTLIPQINIFGHASQSRGGTGKHAALDMHPEYQGVFEPDGWNFCLGNPEATKLVMAMVAELHEAFGNPPYFHIGCDEASEPTCPACKALPYSELLLNHIGAVADMLSQRGAKVMMWHDMFLQKDDASWGCFYHNGSEETAKAGRSLPKNTVICDWFYGKAQKDYPTLKYFKDLGYEVLSCPWEDLSGIRAQANYVQKNGMDGVLGTLWHHSYGWKFRDAVTVLSNSTWNNDPMGEVATDFVTHLRQVCWDMNLKNEDEFALFNHEVPSVTWQGPYPTN